MINELANDVHENAKVHGWWDKQPSFPEIIALCHTELSEALEEYRNGMPQIYYNCCEAEGHPCLPQDEYDCLNYGKEASCKYRGHKPMGIAVELADTIIRILDYCGHAGIDIDNAISIKHEYNKIRPYRHGGKKI